MFYKEIIGIDENGKLKKYKVEIPQHEIDKIKAFDIMVEKDINVKLIKECANAPSYNNQIVGQHLTIRDFSIVKKVIEDEQTKQPRQFKTD